MPTFANKTLWAEFMGDQYDMQSLIAHAQAIGAGGVAIRTVSKVLAASIGHFHFANLKVYAWRWPGVIPHDSGIYAPDEAAHVVEALIPSGLDGYIVDPESEGDGAYNDWNHTAGRPIALDKLAADFCKTIRDAAAAAGNADFVFGLTSGGDYPDSRPHMPWKAFVDASDAVFPQLYWRARDDNNVCEKVGKVGTPKERFDTCLPGWKRIANGKPVIGIAGEISCIQDHAEYDAYMTLSHQNGLAGVHFYADGEATDAQRAMIKAL